jgi:hypothetical protein
MMGHNSRSLQSAAEANVETGVWLLCKEFLITAIQDRRLERGHLRVLACFVGFMNRQNAKAWPDRATIARNTGMTPAAVSNSLSELRKFGYLICDREPVEQSGGKTLMVYTFGNVDHDTIRTEITKFVEQLKRARDTDSSPPTVKSASPPKVKFTAEGENKTHSSPPTVAESSPPTVASNSIEKEPFKLSPPPTAEDKPQKRKTQIQPNWTPREQQVQWVKNNWAASDKQIEIQAHQFRDHHRGKGSLMVDWDAAWRTWWGNGYHKIPRRGGELVPAIRASKPSRW